jgi:RNA recognition motif-containing protein
MRMIARAAKVHSTLASSGPSSNPEGTTLFDRNIPPEPTEHELRVLYVFRHKSNVHSPHSRVQLSKIWSFACAHITLDKETGKSRGTGFICFWNKTDADKVLKHSNSEILRTEKIGHEVVCLDRVCNFILLLYSILSCRRPSLPKTI